MRFSSIFLGSLLSALGATAFADKPSTFITAEEATDLNAPIEMGVASALAGGAWVGNGYGPTIISKNIQYKLTINPVGSVPVGATINGVNYSWGLSYYPTGLTVHLCRGTGTTNCVNVTSLGNGSSSLWNGTSANTPFTFVFKVTGTGSMSPAYGMNDQVIVNYQ